jgi:hypothetical protein
VDKEVDCRELDYSIAEYLLGWDKIHVTNIIDFEGNGWELPNGEMRSVDETPYFTTNIKDALVIYKKYKKQIDKHWDENNFEVNSFNLCKIALSLNNIDL